MSSSATGVGPIQHWSACVTEERPYIRKLEHPLHLSRAVLSSIGVAKDVVGRLRITVEQDEDEGEVIDESKAKQSFLLCTLRSGGEEQFELSLLGSPGETLHFTAEGTSINLFGFFLLPNEGDEDDDEFGDDEDDFEYGDAMFGDEDEEDEDEDDDEDLDDIPEAEVVDSDEEDKKKNSQALALVPTGKNKKQQQQQPAAAANAKQSAAKGSDDKKQNQSAEKPKQQQKQNAEKPKQQQQKEQPKKQEAPKQAAAVADKNAAGKHPQKQLPGGLLVQDGIIGTGPTVAPKKRVTIKYVGKLMNQKKFDSGNNFSFIAGMGEVIKGMDMGVVGMKQGGKRRLTIPAALGYGARGAPPDIPPNATLIFDIEVVKC